MAARVSLTSESDPQGRSIVVVHKAALSGDRRDRQGEARWLRACRANAVTADIVPEVLRVTDQPLITIVMARVPGETLRTSRVGPTATIPILRSVIEALIRLHDQGMVHGNLTLDHVICGSDGVVLISPLGHAHDPGDDQRAVASMMQSMLQRWADWGVTVPERAQWVAMANRLGDPDQPLPLRRALRVIETLSPADHGGQRRLSRGGVTLITVAVSLFLIGLLFDIGPHDDRARAAQDNTSGNNASQSGNHATIAAGPAAGSRGTQHGASPSPPSEAAPEIVWQGDHYRVGAPGDIAVVGPDRCHHQPAVILLESETGRLWAFSDPADGAHGALLSPTSDAVDLGIRPGSGCPEFLVITAAGGTKIISS